jgi:shikimate kinase
MFMLGPKASGKTKIAQEVSQRSNMTHIDFNDFVA